MKYYERAGGYAEHWGTYETDYKSGKLCNNFSPILISSEKINR
jgi:hypothetical protein